MLAETNIREVVIAPKSGEKVPSPISGREDLENRLRLSMLSSAVESVRDSIADCLHQERSAGAERSYLRVLTVENGSTFIVFIERSLHRELQRIAPEIFKDKSRVLSPQENLVRVNGWLQRKVISLLRRQGILLTDSHIELA